MYVALTVAIIGASISVAGWLVEHILSSSADRNLQRLKYKVEFIQKQLEELYGPLTFLILEGRSAFNDLLNQLGRDYIFPEGQSLSKDDLETWIFWVENDFLPRNSKILDIISSKTHLIDGGELPESWVHFSDHYNSWKIQHKRWLKQRVEYSWTSEVNFPAEFEEDVIPVFNRLKQDLAKLMERLR